jgi:hypothetical protein
MEVDDAIFDTHSFMIDSLRAGRGSNDHNRINATLQYLCFDYMQVLTMSPLVSSVIQL